MDRAAADLQCERISVTVPTELAGPDGLYFTQDDPWVLEQGAQLPQGG